MPESVKTRRVVWCLVALCGLALVACDSGAAPRRPHKGAAAAPPPPAPVDAVSIEASPGEAWVHPQARQLVEAARGDEGRAEVMARINNGLVRRAMFRAALTSVAAAPEGAVGPELVARLYELAGEPRVAEALYARLGDTAGVERVRGDIARAEERLAEMKARVDAMERAPEEREADASGVRPVRPPSAPPRRPMPRVSPMPTPEQVAEIQTRLGEPEGALPLEWRGDGALAVSGVEGDAFTLEDAGARWRVPLVWSLEGLGRTRVSGLEAFVPQPEAGSTQLRFQRLRLSGLWHARSRLEAHDALANRLCAEAVRAPGATMSAPSGWRHLATSRQPSGCRVVTLCRGEGEEVACATLALGSGALEVEAAWRQLLGP